MLTLIEYTDHADPPGVMVALLRNAEGRKVSVNRIVARRELTDPQRMKRYLDILAERLELKWASA